MTLLPSLILAAILCMIALGTIRAESWTTAQFGYSDAKGLYIGLVLYLIGICITLGTIHLDT